MSLSKEGLRHFAFKLYDLDDSGSIERFEVEATVRAVTNRREMHFFCAQRGAGVFLDISAKFWRISSPD